MKIEKIEICNLTSFSGSYTIDFTTEPLQSAGLFAITGKTGAGKSTVLDAICLALYGTAPRFENSERAREIVTSSQGDNGELPNDDPRNMLRRGCREASSRVTFSTDSTHTYEATWSVRLTRNNTYDQAKRQLRRLKPGNEQWEGARNVQNQILQITGLDYKQFTATVILAQNSFANFLAAKQKDKSQLLEKLTGKTIYGEMSKRVYQHYQDALRECSNLESRMSEAGQGKLSDEQLREAESRIAVFETSARQLDSELQLCKDRMQWYEDFRQASEQHEQAEEQLAARMKVCNGLYDSQQQLERRDQVLPMFQLYSTMTERMAQIEQNKCGVQQKSAELQQHNQQTVQLAEQHEQALKLKQEADNERRLKEPDIKQAGMLHGKSDELRRAKGKVDDEIKQLQEECHKAEYRSRDIAQQIAATDSQLQSLKLQQQTLSVHRPMLENFSEVRTILDQMHNRIVDNEECDKLNQKAQTDLQVLKLHNQQQTTELVALDGRKQTLTENLQIHMQANLGLRQSDLQQSVIRVNGLCKDARSALDLWLQITANHTQIEEREDKQRRLDGRIDALKTDIARQQQLNEGLLKTRDGLTLVWQTTQNQDIMSLRESLQEGEPCPVCGAISHPFNKGAEKEQHDFYTELANNYNMACAAYDEANNKLIQQQTDLGLLQGEYKENASVLVNLREQQQTCLEQWQRFTYMDQSLENATPQSNTMAYRTMLEQIIESNEKQLAEVSCRNNEFLEHQQQINETNEQLRQLEEEMAQKVNEQGDTASQMALLEAQIDERNKRISGNNQVEGSLFEQIAKTMTLPDWRLALKENYESFIQGLDALVKEWQDNTTQLDDANRRMALLQKDSQHIAEVIQGINADINRRSEDSRLYEDKIAETEREILRLLDGKTLEETTRLMQQREQEVAQAEEAARGLLETAQRKGESLNGEIKNLHTAIDRLRDELHDAETKLDIMISQFNLTHSTLQKSELERIFADKRDWTALRKTISDATDARNKAKYDAEQAGLRLKSLTDSPLNFIDTPDLNIIRLTDTLAQLQQRREELAAKLQDQQRIISNHHASLARLESFMPQQKQLEGIRDQWQRLNHIMGSADGTKFREIAQRYTFDVLVGYTNHQLRALTSRYTLRTKPRTLSLEIIDHDMMDEIRHVNSLSGGETFIISLGLALGLASLQAGSFDIRSLFIDEGFGNLDEDNLNIVIDALSRLQSRQGRKIGVISHTDQIQTRISPRIQVVKQSGGRSKLFVE